MASLSDYYVRPVKRGDEWRYVLYCASTIHPEIPWVCIEGAHIRIDYHEGKFLYWENNWSRLALTEKGAYKHLPKDVIEAEDFRYEDR